MYDLIIIGQGPAGLSAALYAGRAGLKTLILEKEFAGGQMGLTYEIDNYIGVDSISGVDLAMNMLSHAKKFGGEFKSENVVNLILEEDVKVVETTKNKYEAKAVILALGAKPRKLEILGEQRFTGAGVSYCATCDGNFYKGKTTVVIGGGNTAVEDAIFLSRLCEKVYLVHRRDTFRAEKKLISELEKLSNVEIIFDSIPLNISGEQKVSSVTIKNVKSNEEKTLDVEGVFIAVGTIPTTSLIENHIELDKNQYIVTDEKMQTNIKNVYAIGDCRNTILRQVVTSVADGAIAATSVASNIN